MSNYPAPRDIPAGKVLVAEYREVTDAECAKIETIASAYSSLAPIRATVRLLWSSPGFEVAGSAMRWTNGYWAVRWADRSGARFGARYHATEAGEAEARAHFARLTG